MGDETRVLGERYEVGELIGRGGMADVHLGRDLKLGRAVAVKILRTELARDSSFLSRFLREARAAARLDHPSIVAVYDWGEEERVESGGAPLQVPYIVMEHVEGRTLRAVLNEVRVLEPDEATRVTSAVLAALEVSHSRGIVHRDIKPGNVMLTPDGEVKVMDFGIARALEDAAATTAQNVVVLGTARYISPEQAHGYDVDARSDLYSTGCLMYELITGRGPFVGDPVSLVYQHIHEEPPAPSTLRPGIPDGLEAVCLRALRKAPAERCQSAGEFRDDLAAAREGLPAGRSAAGRGLVAVGAAALDAGSTPSAAASPGGQGRPSELGALFDGDDATGDIPSGAPRDEGVRRRRALVAVLAVVALLVGGLVVSQLLSPGSGSAQAAMVSVPALTDLSREQAEAELARLDLEARVEDVASSRPAGTVIGQEPAALATVEVGSTVVLRVSSGPSVVSIPDVRGSREQAARTILEQRNVTVAEQVREVIDVELGAGVVAGTDPAAGEEVEPGSTVTLIVASGDTEVPDLAGLDSTDAIGLLLDNRLRGQIERRPTSAFEAGTVIEHSPASGEVVGYGTDVTLIVASTPPAPPPPPPAPEPVAPPRPPAPDPPPSDALSAQHPQMPAPGDLGAERLDRLRGHDHTRPTRLSDGVRQGDQVVGAGSGGDELGCQPDHLPAPRGGQPSGVLPAQVVRVRLGELGQRPQDGGRVGVDVGQGGDSRTPAGAARALPTGPHKVAPYPGAPDTRPAPRRPRSEQRTPRRVAA